MSTISGKTEYEYKNCPIPGGGYVTGFLYHPVYKGILYARTDIGGVYRYDYEKSSWISLVEHVKTTMIDETFPIAIAVDRNGPDILYIACGTDRVPEGRLCISHDRGETFTYEKIPVPVHGNLAGRGTGFRLIVDPSDSRVLYFASQKNGLLRSSDLGKSWEKMPVPEDYMTFVYVSDDGNTIIAGTAGMTSKEDEYTRGHSLYASYDRGVSFEPMPEPRGRQVGRSKIGGLVASRYAVADKYFFVTMNMTGFYNYVTDLGYSCDSGNVIDGHLVRYELKDGRYVCFEDVTPPEEDSAYDEDDVGIKYLKFGMGGVSASEQIPGLMVCTSLSKDCVDNDCVYRSYDYGQTWEKVLEGLDTGHIIFNSKYMSPEYNGGRSLIHWLSDIKMNPFDKNECFFNTGTGVFKSSNFTDDTVTFTDNNKGIEETVHLNVYAPIDGEVKLVDILGDLGGFAFRNLDTPCDNSFADNDGNRYITCINADLSDKDPNLGIVAARGNWRGLTKGGLIVTRDNFKSFERIPMCYGINDEIDMRMHNIELPNVNPGWVAMSSTGRNIVWSLADNITLPMETVIFSSNYGRRFDKVRIYDLDKHLSRGGLFKVFADRKRESVFYGFDDRAGFYVSTDCGATFYEREVSGYIHSVNFGIIDTKNKTEIRPESGKSGVFYISMGENGLCKLIYDFDTERFNVRMLTGKGDKVYRMGLGLLREGGDYMSEPKAIYICGEIEGTYGFFRSFDDGRSFELISNERQHFGEINSIDGDKRVFGRFFIATGTRGVKYGEIKK